MFKVLGQIKQLPKDQQKFLSSKVIKMNEPLPEALTFLREVMAIDAEIDKVKGKASSLTLLFGFLTFISLGIALASGAPGIIFLPGILLIVFVFFLFKNLALKGVDIPDELKDGIFPFLNLLKNDVKKNSVCNIEINLTGPRDKKKLVNTLKIHRGKNYVYKDRWFKGEMTLGDGSLLTWNFEDVSNHKKYSKRNPRGKVKYKTKTKMKFEKTLTLLTKIPNSLQNTKKKEANGALMVKKKGEKTYIVKFFRNKRTTSKRKVFQNECTDALKSLFSELKQGQ
ncbi:MAG: hypothetical protein NE327_03025 [Lentisphaeraceae bacterium]|nr:hypothetical protein [Lentisphaeraceae bacterium]